MNIGTRGVAKMSRYRVLFPNRHWMVWSYLSKEEAIHVESQLFSDNLVIHHKLKIRGHARP